MRNPGKTPGPDHRIQSSLSGGRVVPDRFDVVVLGEVLVEFHARTPLRAAGTVRLSFSGDALNAAAAAAAAGARTALLTVVGDDELGEALINRVTELGVHTGLIRRAARPNGAYLLTSDLDGGREFVYWRTASAASTLSAAHIESARSRPVRAPRCARPPSSCTTAAEKWSTTPTSGAD
jgi:sugar/nucleoside kinase (ribokinase family)